ncbi:hypothetical protein Plhal304r1_c051g0133761 [Plasmopara halstedii]
MYFEHVGVTLFGSGVAGIYFVSKVPDRRASKPGRFKIDVAARFPRRCASVF